MIETKMNIQFDYLLAAGRDLIEEACFFKQLTPQLLEATSGIPAREIELFLSGQRQTLDGKQWERLMSAVGISHDVWVAHALKNRDETRGPHDSLLRDIDLIATANAFYLEASKRSVKNR